MTPKKGLSGDHYKYIEKVLYTYAHNRELLPEYEDELNYLDMHGDLKVQSYGQGTHGGDVTDRVLDYADRRYTLEKRIERLRVEVKSVDKVIDDLEAVKDTSLQGRKLYAVLSSVYMNNGIEGLEDVSSGELSRLKRQLVYRVWHELVRQLKIIKASK